MDSKSLMIGDWVTFKDCQHENPIPIKIVGIGYQGNDGEENECLVRINGDKACDIIDIDDEIVGISLTAEILEKNGWYIPEDGLWYRHDVIPFFIALRTSGAYLYADEEHDKREFFCSIHYVHELQHCLKLVGIEKEIKL